MLWASPKGENLIKGAMGWRDIRSSLATVTQTASTLRASAFTSVHSNDGILSKCGQIPGSKRATIGARAYVRLLTEHP
jgi:hypothetical protein